MRRKGIYKIGRERDQGTGETCLTWCPYRGAGMDSFGYDWDPLLLRRKAR